MGLRKFLFRRHCEKRSFEAIQRHHKALDCRASLAMTILLSLIFSSFFSSLAQAAPKITTAATSLSRLLSGYTTYTARFTQVTYDHKKNIVQRSRGRILLARPGKFRWEVIAPNKQMIIVNGDTRWIYDVALQQVTETKLAQDQANPAALLSGKVVNLTRNFAIKQQSLGDVENFILRPKDQGNTFTFVKMRFRSGQLNQMIVINNLGQETIFNFTHIDLNKRLSNQLFNFIAPKGVDVLKQ